MIVYKCDRLSVILLTFFRCALCIDTMEDLPFVCRGIVASRLYSTISGRWLDINGVRALAMYVNIIDITLE